MKHFLRENGLWILIIAVLLSVITAATSYVFQGQINPFANIIGVVTTPIRNGIDNVIGWGEGVYNYAFHYEELQQENEALRKENADLEKLIRQSEADSKENDRLRELLELREKRRDFVFESATITAQSTTNWASTLTLSKGNDQGVEVGDCVVDQAGNLVGIIDEVGKNYSIMITVYDASFEVGGLIARTEYTAMLEGDFSLMLDKRLKMTYLPENTQFITGDLILTSGKTGVYPSGLLVGTIESVHTDVSGVTRYAVVAPSVDVSELVQVFIIKDFDIVE